jgi:hypothetical protein
LINDGLEEDLVERRFPVLGDLPKEPAECDVD